MIRPLYLGLAAVSATMLACSIFVGGPALPDPAISGSPEGLQSLQAEIQKAIGESLTGGSIRLTLTQEQLTSYLDSRLSAQTEPLLLNPQVALRDRQMIIYGQARSGMFEANVALTAQFDIDASGQPQFRIVDADVGPMPVPSAFKEALAGAVDEALTGYIGPVATGFRLESIEIADGAMTVTGRLK